MMYDANTIRIPKSQTLECGYFGSSLYCQMTFWKPAPVSLNHLVTSLRPSINFYRLWWVAEILHRDSHDAPGPTLSGAASIEGGTPGWRTRGKVGG